VRGALANVTKTVRGEFFKREQPAWLEEALKREDMVRVERRGGYRCMAGGP
jgi:hypothetical protein